MAEDTTAAAITNQLATTGLVITDEVKQKFPDLVELIVKSESMNTEEKNYWLQVLPVMTTEQVAELRDILETEKKKLAAIDAKYSSQNKTEAAPVDVKAVEEKRRAAQAERKAQEEKQRGTEQEQAESLLSKLDNL